MGIYQDYFSVLEGKASDETELRVAEELSDSESELNRLRSWLLMKHDHLLCHPLVQRHEYVYFSLRSIAFWCISAWLLYHQFGAVTSAAIVFAMAFSDLRALYNRRAAPRGTLWEAICVFMLCVAPFTSAEFLEPFLPVARCLSLFFVWKTLRHGIGLRDNIEACRVTAGEVATRFFVFAFLIFSVYMVIFCCFGAVLTWFITKQVFDQLLQAGLVLSIASMFAVSHVPDHFHCRIWHAWAAIPLTFVAASLFCSVLIAPALLIASYQTLSTFVFVLSFFFVSASTWCIITQGLRAWGTNMLDFFFYEYWGDFVVAANPLAQRWELYVLEQEKIFPPPIETPKAFSYPARALLRQYRVMFEGTGHFILQGSDT